MVAGGVFAGVGGGGVVRAECGEFGRDGGFDVDVFWVIVRGGVRGGGFVRASGEGGVAIHIAIRRRGRGRGRGDIIVDPVQRLGELREQVEQVHGRFPLFALGAGGPDAGVAGLDGWGCGV